MEAEQTEPKQSTCGNMMEYPREETEKAVVQFIGKLFLQMHLNYIWFFIQFLFKNQCCKIYGHGDIFLSDISRK